MAILLFFRESGWQGVMDEVKLDISRIGQRNLGRDDRYKCRYTVALL